MGIATALEYLRDKQDGLFVFRPSSKGPDFLNITWKFFNDVIVHLPIKEGFKSNQEAISQELYLNNIRYSSLEEIIETYIKPCNQRVEEIKRFEKFSSDDINVVCKDL